MDVAHANTAWGDCSCLSLMGLTGTSNLKFFSGFAPRIFSNPLLKLMTRDNKQNLERKLDHLISLMEMLVEQYPHITCAERASMLMTLSMDAKQVAKNVGVVREIILTRLIDEFGVEYSDYARTIEAQKALMIEKVAGAPMLAAIDTMTLPITGSAKILAHENHRYEVGSIKGLSRVDYFLQYFIENSTRVFDDILESLTLIISDLRGIDDEDYYALMDGRLDLQEIYSHLYDEYMELQGVECRDEVEYHLSGALSTHGCNSQEMAQYMRNRRQGYDDLTSAEIDGESAAKIVLQNRKRFTFADLAQHFRNRMEWKLLNEKAEEIRKAEAAGVLSVQANNATIVVGTNVEQQTNNYYINGRKTN